MLVNLVEHLGRDSHNVPAFVRYSSDGYRAMKVRCLDLISFCYKALEAKDLNAVAIPAGDNSSAGYLVKESIHDSDRPASTPLGPLGILRPGSQHSYIPSYPTAPSTISTKFVNTETTLHNSKTKAISCFGRGETAESLLYRYMHGSEITDAIKWAIDQARIAADTAEHAGLRASEVAVDPTICTYRRAAAAGAAMIA